MFRNRKSIYKNPDEFEKDEVTTFPSSYYQFCKRKGTRCKFILVSSSDLDGAEYQGTGCWDKCSRKRSR